MRFKRGISGNEVFQNYLFINQATATKPRIKLMVENFKKMFKSNFFH